MLNKILLYISFALMTSPTFCQEDDFGELKVLEFSSTDCENGIPSYTIQKRIICQEIVNDTLVVEISICTDCGSNNVGIASFKGDTLYLDSGFQLINERDKNGDIVKYLEKGADCHCDYVQTYKMLSDRKFNYILYERETLGYHINHFRPEYKVHEKDTLLLFQDCLQNCYYINKAEYFEKYCYYETGEISAITKYSNKSNIQTITLYNKNGKKNAFIKTNTGEYPYYVTEWNINNEISSDTINNFNDIERSKYYKYLNTF